MQHVDFQSRSAIEDTLWEVGLNIHNLTRDQRMQVLNDIYVNVNYLLGSDILNFVSYILHSYTIQMDDSEKKIVIGIIERKFGQDSNKLGEGLELIALLLKGCPSDSSSILLGLITSQTIDDNTNPSQLISYANAIRYIFDEIDLENKLVLYNSLLYILQETKYGYLKPTIQYTISNIKTLLKS